MPTIHVRPFLTLRQQCPEYADVWARGGEVAAARWLAEHKLVFISSPLPLTKVGIRTARQIGLLPPLRRPH